MSEVPVLSTLSKPSVRFRNRHVGHSVRLTAATCSFCGQTRPSASKASPSRLLSSGTHFHLTSAHRSTVADSSDLSWKLIVSDKPTTLHDSSENNCLRVKLCNCNCNINSLVLATFIDFSYLICYLVYGQLSVRCTWPTLLPSSAWIVTVCD